MQKQNDNTIRYIELLAGHERKIKAFIVAQVPHWSDADNIMQETRIRLWEQFDRYDPSKDFGAWACTIARYLILAYRKQQQHDRHEFSQSFVEAIAEQFDDIPTEDVEARYLAMADCLRKLQPERRELVLRCYSGDDAIIEVANQVGKSVTSIYQRLFRIRQTLHKCIETAVRREEQP